MININFNPALNKWTVSKQYTFPTNSIVKTVQHQHLTPTFITKLEAAKTSLNLLPTQKISMLRLNLNDSFVGEINCRVQGQVDEYVLPITLDLIQSDKDLLNL